MLGKSETVNQQPGGRWPTHLTKSLSFRRPPLTRTFLAMVGALSAREGARAGAPRFRGRKVVNDETRLALDDAETAGQSIQPAGRRQCSARRVGVALLIFSADGLHLIALASVTHRDLLLAVDITLRCCR